MTELEILEQINNNLNYTVAGVYTLMGVMIAVGIALICAVLLSKV